MDGPTVLYDLQTSVQANLYALFDKDLYDKGWRGQYPPTSFAKGTVTSSKAPLTKTTHRVPKINDIVGTKLHHVSPIDKMAKQESQVPLINEASCLQCGRCYLACSDSGY